MLASVSLRLSKHCDICYLECPQILASLIHCPFKSGHREHVTLDVKLGPGWSRFLNWSEEILGFLQWVIDRHSPEKPMQCWFTDGIKEPWGCKRPGLGTWSVAYEAGWTRSSPISAIVAGV